MSGIGSGYDYDVTYSPDGKIFQTEYAQKAVDNSQTTIGMKCKDGVLLATEKPVTSKLIIEHSTRRIFAAARHAGMASAGLPADGRHIVNRATDEARSYKQQYGVPVPGQILAERVANYMHLFTLYGGTRPFGTNNLLAVHDGRAAHALYLAETSGVVQRFFAAAIGKHRQAAKTELEKLQVGDLTCEQALVHAARIFIAQRDDQKPHEIEMGWITEATGWHFEHVPAALVKQAEASAQAALDDADMDDD